jgi:hypothetical protein
MAAHFTEALRAQQVAAENLNAPGEDHFSVLHAVGQPGSSLHGRVLEAIRG